MPAKPQSQPPSFTPGGDRRRPEPDGVRTVGPTPSAPSRRPPAPYAPTSAAGTQPPAIPPPPRAQLGSNPPAARQAPARPAPRPTPAARAAGTGQPLVAGALEVLDEPEDVLMPAGGLARRV